MSGDKDMGRYLSDPEFKEMFHEIRKIYSAEGQNIPGKILSIRVQYDPINDTRSFNVDIIQVPRFKHKRKDAQ